LYKFNHVTAQRRQLPCARSIVTQKRSGQKTSERRRQYAVASLNQWGHHVVPATDAVRPAMGQHNGLPTLGVPFSVAYAKQPGFNELHVSVLIHNFE
jgi:hypothetical protein